jgi:hypothetical protein
MKRPAAIHREAPTPLSQERGARRCGTPGGGRPQGGTRHGGAGQGGAGQCGAWQGRLRPPGRGGGPLGRAPGRSAHPAGQLSELVFAAVRPGFVAACMVSGAAVGDGRRAGWHGHLGDGDRRPGRPVSKRLAGPLLRCAQVSPESGARADGVPLFNDEALRYRTGQNRQMAYFVGQEAGLQGGARRDSAIIPRDCGDARDLRLATLSNDSCV